MKNFLKELVKKIELTKFPFDNPKFTKNTIEFICNEIITLKYVIGISDKMNNPYVSLVIDSEIRGKETIDEKSGEVDGHDDIGLFFYEQIKQYITETYQDKNSYDLIVAIGKSIGGFEAEIQRKDYEFKTTKIKKVQYHIILENKNLIFDTTNDNIEIINFLLTEMYELYSFSNKVINNILNANKFGEKFIKNLYSIGLISSIHIDNYKQFSNNLVIDLTYPKGHKFEGQPLKKICIIGQSGTGKTNLLKLIKQQIEITSSRKLDEFKNEFARPEIFCYYSLAKNNMGHFSDRLDSVRDLFFHDISQETMKEIAELSIEENNSRLVFFPAEITNQIKNIDNEVISENLIETTKIIDFGIENTTNSWKAVQQKILTYREEELKERVKLSKLIESSNEKDMLHSLSIAKSNFENWKKEHPSPVQDLANCLDKYLNKFNVHIKTDIDFHKLEDIKFVKIETEQGLELGNLEEMLSTGTKQVILTTIPLYTLKPKNAILLFDEPERSLYPDIQKDIIPFYTSFGENCQFFFATHSPIVASSFEPWEVVELRYSPKCNLNYEFYSSNHIDDLTVLSKVISHNSKNEYGKANQLIKEHGIPEEVRESLQELEDIEFTDKGEFLTAVNELLDESDYFKYKAKILKASGYGKVYQNLWFEGDRHIDNYKKDPRYLRWDSILMDIYGLETDGNPERSEKLYELSQIGLNLQSLKNEEKNDQKTQLWQQYKKIAQLLNWRTERYEKN